MDECSEVVSTEGVSKVLSRPIDVISLIKTQDLSQS